MSDFLGKLYLFVDRREEGGQPDLADSGNVFAQRAPGEVAWYLSGSAVANGARSTYCARTNTPKLRCFTSLAEAKEFVRKKAKTRPNDEFHLVYDIGGRRHLVQTLEQIQALDRKYQKTLASGNGFADPDKVKALEASVGKIVAGNALELLKLYRAEGTEAAQTRFSQATYARLWQALANAGLV